MPLPSDHDRQIANIVRFGEITDVDMSTKPPMVRVSIDNDVKSDWMPYAQACIGDFYIWSPPTIGTHGIMISENGDNEICRFIPSFNNEANTPALTGEDFEMHFKNGDILTHNSKTGDMTINSTGTITLNSDKDIKLNAKNNIELNAGNNIEIKAKNDITLTSTTIKSDASTTQTHKAPIITADTPLLLITGSISQGSASAPKSKSKSAGTYATFSGPTTINNKLTVNSDVDISGILKVMNDIFIVMQDGTIKLKTHEHGGVAPGGDTTEGPIKL